jgi:hypothetical protein
MFYYLSYVTEVTALITCFIFYRKFNSRRYQLFLPYLFVIVLYELGGLYRMFSIHGTNAWIMNFEVLFEYLFYSYFTISYYKQQRQKKTLTAITLFCFVFSLVDIFFIQGVMNLGTIAMLVQYIILITLACRYFYLKMQEFDVNESLIRNPDFWVNTGMLFFFLAEFLFFSSYTNLAYKRLHSYQMLFDVISIVAIIILYSCLTISFLCFRQMNNTSS